MHRRRPIGTRLATALLITAFTLFAVPAAGRATGRVRFVPVMSGSMSPSIGAGSAAIAMPESLDRVEPGQILVYTAPVDDRRVTIHRVVEVDRTTGVTIVETKGDANVVADPWRAELQGDHVWVVRGSIPFVGQAILWLSSPVVLLLSLVGAVVAAVAVGLRRVWSVPDAEAVGP